MSDEAGREKATIWIHAAARRDQILACAARAEEKFPGGEIVLFVPEKNAAQYEGTGYSIVKFTEKSYSPTIADEWAPRWGKEIHIAVLNNSLGVGSDDLMRMLFGLPGRRFVFTYAGELIEADLGFRLRWIAARIWSRLLAR